MGKVESVRYYFDCLTPYFVYFATRALYNMFTLQHVQLATHTIGNMCNFLFKFEQFPRLSFQGFLE